VLNLAVTKSNTGCCGGAKFDRALWTPLALFFAIVLLSFFFSEYPKQSFRGIFKIAKPLLVFIMAAGLFRDKNSRARFDLAFLITFLLVTIDSSIQYAFGKDLLRGFAAQDASSGRRLVGPFGDFGRMAAYLVLVIPVFALRFWSEFRQPDQRKKSFYVLALSIAAFTLLYLTRCRGPVVALVFSLGCLLVYKRWFKALGIGLALFLTLLAFTPRGMIIHLDADSKEQSLIERIELAKRALDVIEAKPWLGTGINTYNVAHDKYDKEQNWRVRGYYAHNGYLQLAAEIGLPGIFFFLLFLVMFFRRGLREAKAVRGSPEELEQLGILTGLLAFLLYAMADTNLQSPQSLMSFWFMAGLLMAKQKTLQTPGV
jgi:O-antigen ligase